jgi:hypothetical protein
VFSRVEVILHISLMHVVVHLSCVRLVHRQLVVVRADAVAVCVSIGEDAGHKHLIRRDARSGHLVAGRERRLLNLSEEVLRVTIQRHRADLDLRIVLERPDLGQIERLKR